MVKVLITGGAGFVGRHLVRYLLRKTDWEITVLDRLGEGSELQSLAGERLRFVWHDLRAQCRHEQHDYSYILHLAAGSHVDRSVRDPLGFISDNVVGTAHVLEFGRRCEKLIKLLQFSTDEVFGAAAIGAGGFDEYASLYATNPYAASKAAAEVLCPAWANTFGLPVVVTRCTNVAGPGQDEEKFIPSTIAKIKRGQMVQIHARSGVVSSRKYIDVEDVCAAVLCVITRGGVISGRGTGYYNIGGATEHSNLDVAVLLAELMGAPIQWELVEDPPARPRPDMRYDVLTDRLSTLGWTQSIALECTLRRILECA